MCNPASFVLTKDRVFWSMKSDRHEDIIDEFELVADGIRGPNILRVEIIPKNDNFSLDINEKNWTYKIDQDILPEWFNKEIDKNRAFEALKIWQNKRVIINEIIEFKEGIYWVYGSSKVTAYDSSQVIAYDSSQVTAYDLSQVTACGSSQVTVYGSSKVTAYDLSQVTAYNKQNKSILKSSLSVLIDRSILNEVKVFVGQN